MSIAISFIDRSNNVDLWCTVEEVTEDGYIRFWVINGAWEGTLFPHVNMLLVKETGERFPAKKVWEGNAPFSQSQYNEAIQWINEQVKEKNEQHISGE